VFGSSAMTSPARGSRAKAAILTLVLTLATAAAPAQRDVPLPSLPQVTPHGGVTAATLRAQADPRSGRAIDYEGRAVPPVLRVVPGGQLRIRYVNALPVHTREKCALGPCMDMTNLHFHGMDVSPQFGQDDVLTMLAMPGQTLHYDVHIPANAPPGLYWYHTHPHGESDREALDGMSGAIVVEGIDRYVPEVRGLPERILMLRTSELDRRGDAADAAALLRRVDMGAANCGTDETKIEDVYTVNGAVRPSIAIAPGQRQFWRIVNASADSYVDLSLDGTPWKVVAFDGVPLAYYDPAHRTRTLRHVVLPPAGRVEAIVTGPVASHAALRTACVDSGPDGDPMPAQVLADITPVAHGPLPPPVPVTAQPPVYEHAPLAALEGSTPSFVSTFTEGHHRFYINGKTFSLAGRPLTTVRVGTFVHWRIVNKTNEIHPFHIHQVHFLTYAQNGARIAHPVWRDTVNVPMHGTIDVILDATNPVIRGMSVFHCHILSHEDKGMMAKVLFI
jgi:suppressor of ftsI